MRGRILVGGVAIALFLGGILVGHYALTGSESASAECIIARTALNDKPTQYSKIEPFQKFYNAQDFMEFYNNFYNDNCR